MIQHVTKVVACSLAALLSGSPSVTGQTAAASDPDPQQVFTQPALVWTYVGSDWHPVEVALGNRGTQVLAGLWHNPFVGSHASLLSRHDGSPPTPWWEAAAGEETTLHAASAGDADTHVTLTSEDTDVLGLDLHRIHRFSSKGLDWTYTQAQPTSGNALLGVSRDGAVIVAALVDGSAGTTEVLVWGPDSAVPLQSIEVPGSALLGLDVAAQGGHVLITIGSVTQVLDLGDGSLHLVHDSFPFTSSSLGKAISGDGSVVGSNTGDGMALFEWNGSDYVQTWFRSVPGDAVVEISDDATTMAYGLDFLYFDKRIITECVDIPSKTVTMIEDITSAGEYGNGIEDIALTPDGRFFVTATWGDELGLDPEVRLYSRGRSQPVGTLDLPGSALSVDISADGRWIVVGSYPTHVHEPSNSGRVDLVHVGRSDLIMTTVPQLGSAVRFDVFGEPGSDAFLLDAPQAAVPGIPYPGWGTLHLDPATLSITPMGVIGPDGRASATWTLPDDPALLGVSRYVQGLRQSSARRLTWDWLVVTLVP